MDREEKYLELAQKYADIAARCLKNDAARQSEIDGLTAAVAVLSGTVGAQSATIQALSATIDELRREVREARKEAHSSGSFAAQEVYNQRELKTLRDEKKDRRAFRAKVIAAAMAAVLSAFVIYMAGQWQGMHDAALRLGSGAK